MRSMQFYFSVICLHSLFSVETEITSHFFSLSRFASIFSGWDYFSACTFVQYEQIKNICLLQSMQNQQILICKFCIFNTFQLYYNKMKDNGIGKIPQLPQTNALFKEAGWISQPIKYEGMNLAQLQNENQRILATLKVIQNKLTSELALKKKIVTSSRVNKSENVQALEQKIKNNEKFIGAMKHDLDNFDKRRVSLNKGLQSKTIDDKFNLQRKINSLKTENKQLKLQEHEIEKALVKRGDINKPEDFVVHQRMEQQLRVLSIKYVRLLDQYNRSTEKLALASNTEIPDINVPEDIYDKQLEEREEAQFKQYQGIVKLCTVLSHRNDSEHNKAHREYTIKLKELQKLIMRLGQLDQAITTRQGEIIESRKNMEIIKMKMSGDEGYDSRVLRLSQGSLAHKPIPRGKSYSNIKLQQLGDQKGHKLRNRGYSLTKLKAEA